MRNIFILAALAIVVTGCSIDKPDLKSPCVGAKGSPCGPKTPVNDWWLKGDSSQHV